MFGLFKKSKDNGNPEHEGIKMADMDGNSLEVGDRVISLRYDIGECLIHRASKGFYYESITTGEQVSWLKMVDAATLNQKVKKID